MSKNLENKTFIIAEVGSNFTSLRDCLDSISLAANCGADAVKFQYFCEQEMYGYGSNVSKLPEVWLEKLAEKAEACMIELMVTAFSPEGLAKIDPYVVRHKIASSDLCYKELLLAAGETGKELILSTGGHSLSDIGIALKHCDPKKVTLLYCESSYPSYDVDFRKLHMLEQFELPLGFSDHTKQVYMPAILNAISPLSVVEKHVNFTEAGGDDAYHSIDTDDFKMLVGSLRGDTCESLISGDEADMITKHNRRLVAIKDIAQGDALEYDRNYGPYRSKVDDAHGMHPMMSERVTGMVASRDIAKGEGIGPGDLII